MGRKKNCGRIKLIRFIEAKLSCKSEFATIVVGDQKIDAFQSVFRSVLLPMRTQTHGLTKTTKKNTYTCYSKIRFVRQYGLHHETCICHANVHRMLQHGILWFSNSHSALHLQTSVHPESIFHSIYEFYSAWRCSYLLNTHSKRTKKK